MEYMNINIRNIVRSSVPPEVLKKLEIYVQLLLKWNRKINLVSRRCDEEDLWDMILDSLALRNILQDNTVKVIDIGSGGGFPIIVLAIAGYQNCISIELSTKKYIFLAEVARTLALPIHCINANVEDILHIVPDVISAKAVTDMANLFHLCRNMLIYEDPEGTSSCSNYAARDIQVVTYKQSNQSFELDALAMDWQFTISKHPLTYKTGTEIWQIKDIKPKREHQVL